MPRCPAGQLYTFAIQVDDDQKFESWIWLDVKAGDTVQKIAARRGHPELARKIADANDIRSVRSKFSGRGLKRIRVPGLLKASAGFDVLAGDRPFTITEGYAKYETTDRPQREGLNEFTGYDPLAAEVDVHWENVNGVARIWGNAGEGEQIERDIALLERMAGRGNFAGASVGPPPVIRVSATDNSGQPVNLIPPNYQWSQQNPSAPLWRVVDIDWADDVPTGVLRNKAGNRIRQKATIRLSRATRAAKIEHTRSATARSRARSRKK